MHWVSNVKSPEQKGGKDAVWRQGRGKPRARGIGGGNGVGVREGWGPGVWPLPAAHPPSLGSPVPDSSLAAPAPCPAAAAADLLCQPHRQAASAQAQLLRGPGSGSPATRPVCPPCPRPFPRMPALSCALCSQGPGGGASLLGTPGKGPRRHTSVLPGAGPAGGPTGPTGPGHLCPGREGSRDGASGSPGPQRMQSHVQRPVPPGPSCVTLGR